MLHKAFDPNDIARPNGNFFGFPMNVEDAQLILYPVPWDVTTSYSDGTSRGPQAMIDASVQLDFHDDYVPYAWDIPYGTHPIDPKLLKTNDEVRTHAKKIIEALENGTQQNDSSLRALYKKVNKACQRMVEQVFVDCSQYLDQGKVVGLVGGDHSTSLGLLRAINEHYKSFGILQIDAHADLRDSYEGFKYSHASIMHNAAELDNLFNIVQVGIRDQSPGEVDYAMLGGKNIMQYPDSLLCSAAYQGRTWESLVQEMIRHLPPTVYVSVDIDGLEPSLCPNTGTPVPGGLTFNQLIFLFDEVVKSGRVIVGFDVVEVAPSGLEGDEWDANVGARVLYKLGNQAWMSNQNFDGLDLGDIDLDDLDFSV